MSYYVEMGVLLEEQGVVLGTECDINGQRIEVRGSWFGSG